MRASAHFAFAHVFTAHFAPLEGECRVSAVLRPHLAVFPPRKPITSVFPRKRRVPKRRPVSRRLTSATATLRTHNAHTRVMRNARAQQADRQTLATRSTATSRSVALVVDYFATLQQCASFEASRPIFVVAVFRSVNVCKPQGNARLSTFIVCSSFLQR